jgi:3-methyladenine DNA glycosylase AlkC
MEPLKNLLNLPVYENIAREIERHYPEFNTKQFVEDAGNSIEALELKERVILAAELCAQYLPDDFRTAVGILMDVAASFESEQKGLVCFFMPEFVARNGLDYFEFSLDALEFFTRYSTSESGIRPFLMKDFDRAIKRMYKWSENENHHVRRLSSEGSRPRLPWAPQLPMLMENPEPVRPIMENLKADDILYVRKSVANHLNDISKDNPDWMLALVKEWDLTDERTAWIVKRGARTLIKQGHPRAFSLFGYTDSPQYTLKELSIDKPKVNIGDEITFSFDMTSASGEIQSMIVDYIVHYVKKNGKTSPKVFKLKDVELPAWGAIAVRKRHQFIDMSTRTHYPGIHRIEIQVNGEIAASVEFDVLR